MQRGFSGVLLVFVVLLVAAVGVVGFYFVGNNHDVRKSSFEHIPEPNLSTTSSKKETPATTSAQIDGVVWNDVNQRVVMVNLFYAKYHKLPKTLEEVVADPEFSFHKLNNNPINNQPYHYQINPDGKSFEVNGVQNDGILFRQIIEVN